MPLPALTHPNAAHHSKMMSAAECTAKAESMADTASVILDGQLRLQMEATAREWYVLAVTAKAHEELQNRLLGSERS